MTLVLFGRVWRYLVLDWVGIGVGWWCVWICLVAGVLVVVGAVVIDNGVVLCLRVCCLVVMLVEWALV